MGCNDVCLKRPRINKKRLELAHFYKITSDYSQNAEFLVEGEERLI